MKDKPTELRQQAGKPTVFSRGSMSDIAHGNTTHSFAKRFECMFCIDVEIDYLYDLKKAGGQTKFLEKVKQYLAGT